MKLADKPVYPQKDFLNGDAPGLTFRERLTVALASNPRIAFSSSTSQISLEQIDYNAKVMVAQADAIIKQLEEEKK